MEESLCPQCNKGLTQVGKFWVCPDHGQVDQKKSFSPLRIFISYGHDKNEDLVKRIKADIERRGHDVWFDKTEIKAGDNWRREITDGILHSQRVVSFLSKHSTRDPGVCRDEIAIAIGVKGGNIQTILVESETEVQAPVNIGHIQWLDMHDWMERQVAGGTAWEEWYQAKLTEIVRIVESDESRRFAGEIEALHGHLKPIRSEARIYDLLRKGFFGRSWLFEAVEGWRQNVEGDSRLFWIIGDPGVGKSAFAAQLTHTRSDAVIAAQFIEWDKPDHRDAQRVVRSLAFQLATRLPDYRKLLLTLPEIGELDSKNPAELFDYLITNPLRSVIGGGRERQLMVIDAIDEAGEAGRNSLVEMLARHAPSLPEWLGLIVTSRPESAVQTPLQELNPFVLDARSEANRADLRDYLRCQLASQLQDRPPPDRLIKEILEKSEGVFLYIERFCEDVQRNHLSLERPEEFPQGLGGIFYQWFQRQFPDLKKFRNDVRPTLRVILAALEPLPLEILQRLFNWQDEELLEFIRPLISLFPIIALSEHKVIKPCHKSLADWVIDEKKAGCYYVSIAEGHKMLADLCWEDFQRGHLEISMYALRYLPRHLQESNQWQRLADILCAKEFVDARSALDPTGIITVKDYISALQALPEREWRRIWQSPLECAKFAMAGVQHLADHGEHEKCKTILSQCGVLILARKSPELTSNWHSLSGRLAIDQGNFEEAERIILEGLRLAREAKFDKGLASSHDELCVLLHKSGRAVVSADDLLQQAIEIQSSVWYIDFRVQINLKLSMVLIHLGHPILASAHLDDASATLTENSAPSLKAALKKCQGYLSLFQGEYQLASTQFASARAEFERAKNKRESLQCNELYKFALLTKKEKSHARRVQAWRMELILLSQSATRPISTTAQAILQKTLYLLDTLDHPVEQHKHEANEPTHSGANTVIVGTALDELMRSIDSIDGSTGVIAPKQQSSFTIISTNNIDSDYRKEQFDLVCERVSSLVKYGKVDEAWKIVQQLPDSFVKLAELKNRLSCQIKSAESEIIYQYKTEIKQIENFVISGDFRSARNIIELLPNSPDVWVRMKRYWDVQAETFEAVKFVNNACDLVSGLCVAGKLADARKVVNELPDMPRELADLKSRLMEQIAAAEFNTRGTQLAKEQTKRWWQFWRT